MPEVETPLPSASVEPSAATATTDRVGSADSTERPSSRFWWYAAAVALALLALGLLGSLAQSPPAAGGQRLEIALSNGRFFAARPDGSAAGFRVTDDASVPFWTTYQRRDGLNALGLPVSRRFLAADRSIQQVFERGALSWDQVTGQVELRGHQRPLSTGGAASGGSSTSGPGTAEPTLASGDLVRLGAAYPDGAFRPEYPFEPASAVAARLGHVPIVVLDPGHGGVEIGSEHRLSGGRSVQEKHVNLEVARIAAGLLREAGYHVVLTRQTDEQVNVNRVDVVPDGKVDLRDDLQSRIDLANAAKADVLVSVHFNGHDNPRQSGTEVYYCEERPFSEKSLRLATLAQSYLVRAIRAGGYATLNRGVKKDSELPPPGSHLYLLGPSDDRILRPSEMPAVLVESLFVSHAAEADLLAQEWFLHELARGLATSVTEYFRLSPSTSLPAV
ncbi:MAG: N-acetylmuramoyl-L-alanine amidase [Chloroflexi bacterium]|nr:N-acetylmuramoyl-L-alanine amidase [Chloroflexota bacterium]